jgi:hypothetical protein
MGTDDTSTVVAFYGVASLPCTDVATLYDVFLGWFSAVGCTPDKLAVSGTGHSGRQVGFPRKSAIIKSTGFRGITGFSLTAMRPGGEIPTIDYEATADYSSKFSYALIAGSSRLVAIGPETAGISKDVVRLTKPSYGIGYSRPLRLGPTFYAIGLSQGLGSSDSARPEAIRISRWADKGMKNRVYNDGVLRDVYVWNFLNDAQRASRVEGKRLEDWIARESWRGELRDFSQSLALWKVSEEHHSRVRNALVDAGLIFLGAPGPA